LELDRMFEPLLNPAALLDQVHDRLVVAIAEGALSPGERLTQEEVAARLGVSRQPVSHALQVLRRRGLVVQSGKRGLVVAPLDAARLRDLYQVRAALEGLAASLAAKRVRVGAVTPEQLDEGNAQLERGHRLSEGSSIGALIAADVDFHSYLHRLSGNQAIVETIAMEWPHFKRAMGAVLADAAVRRRLWAEHAEILRSIIAGEPSRAAEAARRHIEHATEETAARLERHSINSTDQDRVKQRRKR
jgi:DNA-binding GntR family transcriptional regulator